MTIRIIQGDCRTVLPTLEAGSVQCIVTSPPYFGLRDYGVEGQIGLEASPAEYIAEMVAVFREVRRVLRDDGTLWLNLGDSYSSQGGSKEPGAYKDKRADGATWQPSRSSTKPKDLLMMPARVAIALQADGWYLRSQMPWVKRGCMPESATDRPTNAIEYIFLFTKNPSYFYDSEAVKKVGAIPAGTRAAKGSNVRSELKDVNGRPPEYWEYTGSRNFRNTDLFYESAMPPWGALSNGADEIIALDVNTQAFPGAHFATFPAKLIEPLIKAGTSEKGCCAACGAPWKRQIDAAYENPGNRTTNGPRSLEQRHETAGFSVRLEKRTKTTGWQPTCDCPPAKPVPCTVLDPFSGAGTTALVADRLGRNAIGIELNPAYSTMAHNRITDDGPLFADISSLASTIIP